MGTAEGVLNCWRTEWRRGGTPRNRKHRRGGLTDSDCAGLGPVMAAAPAAPPAAARPARLLLKAGRRARLHVDRLPRWRRGWCPPFVPGAQDRRAGQARRRLRPRAPKRHSPLMAARPPCRRLPDSSLPRCRGTTSRRSGCSASRADSCRGRAEGLETCRQLARQLAHRSSQARRSDGWRRLPGVQGRRPLAER